MHLHTIASASHLARDDRRAYLRAAQIDELQAELRLPLTPARRYDVENMLAQAKALQRQGR